MLSGKELGAEVAELVERGLSEGRTVQAASLVGAVISRHERIEGEDKDFYLMCAWSHVRVVVRQILRRYKGEPAEACRLKSKKETPPMHKQLPKPAFPTVAEIIEASPGVRLNGNVETAWKLVAGIDCHSGGDIRLALAVGCLCRALAERTGNDLDESGRNGPGWVS